MPQRRTKAVAAATVSLIAAFSAAPALATSTTGPSTDTDPYVVPVAPSVSTTSILTVGDTVDRLGGGEPYRMVGIPDGLGVNRGGSAMRVYMNHELPFTRGSVRRHGQTGAFVSQLDIDRRSLRVYTGFDLIDPGVLYWDYPSETYSDAPSTAGENPRDAGVVTAPGNPTATPPVLPTIARDQFLAQEAAFGRFCSGDLTDEGQLLNEETGRGYDGRVYFANEEVGDEGRAFGVTEDGTAQQLQRLGLFSWENTLAAHNQSDTTLVVGNEDDAAGQLRAYVGRKGRRGDAFDKAGLTNGANFVARISDGEAESAGQIRTDAQFRAQVGKGEEANVTLAEVDWDQSGAAQNRESAADGLSLNRIEDGAFDPSNPNDYYFLTTEGGKGSPESTGLTGRDGGGVWRMRFDDIERPELGGTLELLLDGSETPLLNKPDNMDIDRHGNLLIQEDPGRNVSIARIVAYRIDDGARGVVAEFDRELFAPATAGGEDAELTVDEESSGIVDTEKTLGRGTFLFDAQVHPPAKVTANPDGTFPPSVYNNGKTIAADLVEDGQLLKLKVRDFDRVYDGE
ncbi:MAG: DUF839 domain-containing protein [Solirubrobacterales bacterium]|nr:DUF839 domain-containing protein [Solirubrobacterales bacterium]